MNKLIKYTVQIALDRKFLTETWLRLNDNETWGKNITFVPDKEGMDLRLKLWLFKGNNLTEPYRQLHLWVNI